MSTTTAHAFILDTIAEKSANEERYASATQPPTACVNSSSATAPTASGKRVLWNGVIEK